MRQNITGALIVTYKAESEIKKYRLVAVGVGPGTCKQATSGADIIRGTHIGNFTVETEEMCDVIRDKIAPVIYGANVNAGDPLTSDAEGRGIPASAGQRIAGYAEVDGILNQEGSLHVMPGIL